MQYYFQDKTVRNNVFPKLDAEYINGSRRYIRIYSNPEGWLTDNLIHIQQVSPSWWFFQNGMTDQTMYLGCESISVIFLKCHNWPDTLKMHPVSEFISVILLKCLEWPDNLKMHPASESISVIFLKWHNWSDNLKMYPVSEPIFVIFLNNWPDNLKMHLGSESISVIFLKYYN